jgi:hypothetical protein
VPHDYILRLTTYRVYANYSQPCSSRACSRDDPEGGARRGVLRRRLVTARPGGSGPRRPGTMTWVRGARSNRSGANAGERSAAPEPKTATVERREASVPRHKRVHARLDALWDARRLARCLACRDTLHAARVPLHPNVSRRSATPRLGDDRSKVAKTWAQTLRRGNEQDWLFDIVRRMTRALRPHPEERACEILAPNANARARVSKDADERLDAPSCFETPRSADELARVCVSLRAARLLSMTASEDGAFWPSKGLTRGCRKWARREAPCFRPVLYRELCNYSAWRVWHVTRGQKRVEDARRRAYHPRAHHSPQKSSSEADGLPGQARQ